MVRSFVRWCPPSFRTVLQCRTVVQICCTCAVNKNTRRTTGTRRDTPHGHKKGTQPRASQGRATIDKVDDRLSVTVPVGGFTGTMVLATDQGTASYGVTIPAGAYDIGGRNGQYFPGNAIVGQLIRDGALSAGDAAATEAYFVEKGANAGYGAVTNFRNFWKDWSEITSFPLIDTSSGTNFQGAWWNCSSLTSLPLINTSAGTNFGLAWRNCSSLTSFPLIDTSSGTNFSRAWFYCSSLTSFPANAFDNIKGGNFSEAFRSTALTQTSIDNILVSLVHPELRQERGYLTSRADRPLHQLVRQQSTRYGHAAGPSQLQEVTNETNNRV